MTRRSISIAFAILAIALMCYLVDLKQLWAALSNLSLESILYLALLSFALIYVSALKWGYFLERLGAPVSSFRLFNLYLIGYFVNLLIPSYVGGDVARSWYIGKKVGQHEALTATILERYTGMIAMVALAFTFIWYSPLVTTPIRICVVLMTFAIIGITAIALSSRLLNLLEIIPPMKRVSSHLKKIQSGLRLASRDPALLFKSLSLSLLFHALTVVNTMIAAYAVGWLNPPINELFVVVPIILLVGAIPLAPNGLGLQEGAFFYFLHGVGATPAQALGVALVLRAKSYVLAIFGGVVWLFERNRKEKLPV